jgi:hypothetical protein
LKTSSPDEGLQGAQLRTVNPESSGNVGDGHAALKNHCPVCGKEMERGYLGMEKVFSDISWFNEKTTFGTGGIDLHIKDKLGIAYIDAYRCRDCRVIEAKY